jgi:uncharacterized membrane protein
VSEDGMTRNTWKIIVGTSAGIELQDEADTVEEALTIVQQAMREMAHDPGSDIRITFDDKRLDSTEA